MPFPIVPVLLGVQALAGILGAFQSGNAKKKEAEMNEAMFNKQHELAKQQFDFEKKQTGIQNLFAERGMQNQTRGINMNAMEMLGAKRDIMRNKSVNRAMYNSLFPTNQKTTPDFNQFRGGGGL